MFNNPEMQKFPQIPGNLILQPICLDSLAGNTRILGVKFVVIKKNI